MRIFLIGDVHGNLEALNSVFEDMRNNYLPSFFKKKNDKSDILGNLGDLVGYMANPNEVVDKVTSVADFNLPGNHDIAAGDLDRYDFTPEAKIAINWTAGRLNSKNRKKLEKICENGDLTVKIGNAVFAHSTPHYPSHMRYIENRLNAKIGFFQHEKFKGMHAFVGHRHVPQFYCSDSKGEFDVEVPEEDDIETGVVDFDRTFLRQVRTFPLSNVISSLSVIPSVGQPRDGNPLSGYAIYYPEEQKIEMIRVPYDISAAQNKMLYFNLPERLAERLDFGN